MILSDTELQDLLVQINPLTRQEYKQSMISPLRDITGKYVDNFVVGVIIGMKEVTFANAETGSTYGVYKYEDIIKSKPRVRLFPEIQRYVIVFPGYIISGSLINPEGNVKLNVNIIGNIITTYKYLYFEVDGNGMKFNPLTNRFEDFKYSNIDVISSDDRYIVTSDFGRGSGWGGGGIKNVIYDTVNNFRENYSNIYPIQDIRSEKQMILGDSYFSFKEHGISKNYTPLKLIGKHHAIIASSRLRDDDNKDLDRDVCLYNYETNKTDYITTTKYINARNINLFTDGAIIKLSLQTQTQYIIIKLEPKVSIEIKTTNASYNQMSVLPINTL